MASLRFKNVLRLRDKSYGTERRRNLAKEVLSDSTPLPEPVDYEDIDREIKEWVEKELKISFEGKDIPTYTLYSNQRFSEYRQMWEHVDENKNPILNFKAITRETNPQVGTIYGENKNVPGERTYLMKRVEARDKNDRPYYIDYRMKQPLQVDLIYIVSVFTDKYVLLNTFNTLVHDKFKAITCYIRPKGHFMSMTLENISDESQYNIDDRQFYSQNCSILVRAYILPKEYFIVEEKPKLKFLGFEGEESKKTYAEIEDIPGQCPVNDFYYKPVNVNVSFDPCDDKIKFTIDCNFTIQNIEKENVRSFILLVNDEEIDYKSILEQGDFINLNENDEIKIYKLRRIEYEKCSFVHLKGYDRDIVYDKKLNYDERLQPEEEIDVEIEGTDCQKVD